MAISEKLNFILINAKCMYYFRYGGSPAIPRQVIRNHRGEIEVRKKVLLSGQFKNVNW